MNEAALRRHMRKWQKRLSIEDWRIQIKTVPENHFEDEDGHIHWCHPNMTATIELAETLEPEMAQESTIHEIIHIVLLEMCLVAEIAMRRLSEDAANLLRDQHTRALEQATWRLARAFRALEKSKTDDG